MVEVPASSADETVLVVSPLPAFPPVSGGPARIYNIASQLARRYRTILIQPNRTRRNLTDPKSGIEIHEVKNLPLPFRLMNPYIVWETLRILRSAEVRAIVGAFPWGALPAYLPSRLYSIPLVLDEHNVEKFRVPAAYGAPPLIPWLVEAVERRMVRGATLVWCVSDEDRGRLAAAYRVSPEKCHVIPNGVTIDSAEGDTRDCRAIREDHGISPSAKVVLFFGALDYPPNLRALQVIKAEILPRVKSTVREVLFVIAGHGQGLEEWPEGMLPVGWVRDLNALIRCSDLVISPIAEGGGTRIKVLEAIAGGKIVVSTPIGAEGIDQHVTGDQLVLATDWNEFASQIVRLLADSVGRTPPDAFWSVYSWEAIGDKLLDTLSSLPSMP